MHDAKSLHWAYFWLGASLFDWPKSGRYNDVEKVRASMKKLGWMRCVTLNLNLNDLSTVPNRKCSWYCSTINSCTLTSLCNGRWKIAKWENGKMQNAKWQNGKMAVGGWSSNSTMNCRIIITYSARMCVIGHIFHRNFHTLSPANFYYLLLFYCRLLLLSIASFFLYWTFQNV